MIFHDFNWYSVPLQVESVQKLLQYDFLNVLPGHGREIHLKDAAQRLKAVSDLVAKYSDPAVLAKSSPMRGRE